MPKTAAVSATPSAADPLPPDPTPADGLSDQRWLDLLAPRHAATTVMLCMGVALFAFNGFLVTTVMPSAIAEIGGGHLIAWSVSLYLIGSIVSGASAAALKSRFGARLVMLIATLLFLAGTLGASFATSMPQVLIGRMAQGLGEGVVAALCYALIPALYPTRLVPKVFGAEAMVWAVASFGGPFAAGWITETVSWRGAFLVNVPLGLIFLVLALKTATPRDISDTGNRIPLAPLLLLAAGMLVLLSAGSVVDLRISALTVLLGLALVGSSVIRDRKASHRLMPEGAFGLGSTVGAGLWIVLLMPVAQATSAVYIVFGLQHVFGYGPTAAGGFGAVMAMSWSVVAVLIANLTSPSARRRAIRGGPVLQCAGMILVAGGMGLQFLPMLVLGQALVGAAFGSSWSYLNQMLMASSPAAERDKTSGLLPTLQSAGYAIGAALAGLTANSLGFSAGLDRDTLRLVLTATFILPILWTLPAMVLARRTVGLAPPPWGATPGRK
ncbi:MFS transporter [Rhizobium wuzhouense]|uniref:MFS transporter n=1 Tax=Rhizobium wuzhouense TaxID=1986026 RepID=A0ABX5NXX9_9HYPH|nr:MFS transporter [Rhizobium wuzhouense]PYB77194.1 MFS transporter [Rhizobium wuzhouense]